MRMGQAAESGFVAAEAKCGVPPLRFAPVGMTVVGGFPAPVGDDGGWRVSGSGRDDGGWGEEAYMRPLGFDVVAGAAALDHVAGDGEGRAAEADDAELVSIGTGRGEVGGDDFDARATYINSSVRSVRRALAWAAVRMGARMRGPSSATNSKSRPMG